MSDFQGGDHQNQDGPRSISGQAGDRQRMASAPGGAGAPPPAPNRDILRNPLVLILAIVIIIAAIVGAYFLGNSHHTGTTASVSGAANSGETRTAAELSARGVCEAALDRIKAYGVVEPDTTLTSNEAEKTSEANRLLCNAKSGQTTYRIAVDQLCNDMGQDKCIKIWNVVDGNGKGLYQQREFLPPEE